MKAWILVIVVIYPRSLDPLYFDALQDRVQNPEVALDTDCLDNHCAWHIDGAYKSKEECRNAGEPEVLGPAKARDGGIVAVRYKCQAVDINWIEQQQSVRKKCPPELQEGYRRSLRLIKNPSLTQYFSEAIEKILALQKTLGCQLD